MPRSLLALAVAAQVACLPEIKERCRLITQPAPAPALPHDLAQLDSLLIRRAVELAEASRGLRRFQVWWFRVGFAEQMLPDLCGRLEQARALAMAGRTTEAGRKYQAILVASQVMQFAVAMHGMAQHAEIAGQPGGQITQTIATFTDQAKPILDAALSEDPQRIARAINDRPQVFREWAGYLERWTSQVADGVERAKVAKLVWDALLLVAATYQAAGTAAEIAVSGRPPMPPLAAFAPGGGATTVVFSRAASIELAEAIRRLVASGALDAAVVSALSKSLSISDASPAGAGTPASRTWGDPSTLDRHLRDHGKDFGARTPDEYAEQASKFLERSRVQRLPTKIDADGVIRVYEPKTNTFGAYNAGGTTRTFFKPTSPTYFERQPGSSPWPSGGG